MRENATVLVPPAVGLLATAAPLPWVAVVLLATAFPQAMAPSLAAVYPPWVIASPSWAPGAGKAAAPRAGKAAAPGAGKTGLRGIVRAYLPKESEES